MDTQRRHDLRENELAQQLESLSDFARQHGRSITLGVLAVLVLAAGWWYYASNRDSARRDAWQALTDAQAAAQKDTVTTDRVAKIMAVADRTDDSGVRRAALRQVVEMGLSGRSQAIDKADSAAAQSLTQTVKTAAERLLNESSTHADIAAIARCALAVLAEDRHDYAEAERLYREVASDARLKDTPIATQAQYRLDRLKDWRQPVTFAPASMPATAPTTQPAPAAAPASTQPAATPAATAPAADPNRVTN